MRVRRAARRRTPSARSAPRSRPRGARGSTRAPRRPRSGRSRREIRAARREVLLEPGAQLGPERRFLGGVPQVHRTRSYALAGKGRRGWLSPSPRRAPRRPQPVRAPEVLGKRRQHVVPDRGEAADQLRDPRRPRHEPPVQVLAAVAPAAHVHAADLADRPHRALDSREQDAELGGQVVGQVARLREVLARLEQDDDGEPGRPVEAPQPPALARPEVRRRRGRSSAGSRRRPRRSAGARSRREAGADAAASRPRTGTCPSPRPQASAALRRRARTAARPSRARAPMLTSRAVEWPQSFSELKRGEGCGMCADGRPEADLLGRADPRGLGVGRVPASARISSARYTIVIWRGRHAAEPTQLTDEEAAHAAQLLRAAGERTRSTSRPCR